LTLVVSLTVSFIFLNVIKNAFHWMDDFCAFGELVLSAAACLAGSWTIAHGMKRCMAM
jgi:hypothetical protein